MADVRTLTIVEDLGSEHEREVRKSYNALLNALGDFLDAAEAATTVGDINTAATAMKALIETDTAAIRRVVGTQNIPQRPARAVTS